MADIHTLGDMVREGRTRAGLTMRELATKLSIHYAYISDIENDRRVPSVEVLESIAAHLKLDLDELLALAGRFGKRADRYLRRHPKAGILLRRIADANLSDDHLDKLLLSVERMSKSK